MKQRASAFASLKNAESLASAKIGLLVSLTNGSFGLAIFNDQFVIVEGAFLLHSRSIVLTVRKRTMTSSVLTMYEKSGAKGAKHSWTSSTTSIGAISYLAVRCYQHTRQRQFRAMECVVTRTTQFTHLPSFAFLCIVPQGMIRRSSSSHFLELLPGPFETMFQDLIANKQAVVGAVKGLLRPSRKSRVGAANAVDDDD